MAQANNEKLHRRFRILVAPLDWGLGHATRCIPIVNELLSQNCDVWLAGEGQQEALLRAEFPGLPFLPLEGYRMHYSARSLGWKIILQIPRMIQTIGKEHRWLKEMMAAHQFDAVISDNRYGLYHKRIPAVLITHQLTIKGHLGTWSENILRRWNYKYIQRFSECWVPDVSGPNSLAGELSHPIIKPKIPLRYAGWLSRFEKKKSISFDIPKEKTNHHLLFILSGPEPQRSILENKIINEVSHYPGTATIVRGVPTLLTAIPSTGMIKFYNHLSARELNEEAENADWVISRSGYSTIMDLVKLGKKAILIPTPGQTEQEYLAAFLNQKQIALSIEQRDFSLQRTLDKAKKFNYKFPILGSTDDLRTTVQTFLSKLGK